MAIETAGQLQAAIEALPERERQVFLLRYQQGLAFAEIALRLGVSDDDAERSYRRALAMLQRRLW